MSCCCCCRWELLDGIRKKERLLPEEEPGGGGGEGGEAERSRRNMDVSLLREQYRSSRRKQKTETQVLLFRTVSEELSDAVSVVPVTQVLSPFPPTITFDPDPTTYDPWQVHLDLHRHSRTIATVQPPVSSPETNTSIDSSSRCSSSSSEAGSSQQESRSRKLSVDSTPDSLSSCREMSPCSSFSTREENHPNVCGSRGDPDSERSTVHFVDSSKVDSVRVSLTRSLSLSEQRSREGPPDGSFSLYNKDSVCSSDSYSQESLVPDSRTSSDESSTPVASTTGSPSSSTTNLHQDLKETQSAETKSSNGVLQTSITPTWRGSRKFSAPANRLTRQLSVGGEGSSTGVQHNQNYYPFPSRKTPRISEAAKRLGMYSSF